MGKEYKMPTVDHFLKKKILYSKKRDLEWEFLEKEMLDNIDKKPYNQKVHDWLVYLKELKQYYRDESKRQVKRLLREAGPPWYVELSLYQKEVLKNLKSFIHQDIIENLPRRTRKGLFDLGCTLKLSHNLLLKTMSNCEEDPGLFLWDLYKTIYNKPPSELKSKYDMNSRLIMSSLVFIDIDECLEELEKLTYFKTEPVVKIEKKERYYTQPNVKFGEYLQTMTAACYLRNRNVEPRKPRPLGNKLRLRSEQSYEDLLKDENFLQKRRNRNMHEKEKERICTYKFWEPPSSLRNNDPKQVAYINKLKMFKLKAKPKFVSPLKNIQFQIGNVTYAGGKPNYIIQNVNVLPTGYIFINAGNVLIRGSYVTVIAGNWKFPMTKQIKCESTCDCLAKWDESVMNYLKESKCKCGHHYDFGNEGKATEKYFYSSTRYGKYWIDEPKIFQMDPIEDFIKDTIEEGLRSEDRELNLSRGSVSAAGLKEHELLQAFLADISDSALMIPHLPQANYLNNLKEWARKRVKGDLISKEHRRMMLQSQRRWLNLKHVDHRARAYIIPLTPKQVHNFSWCHRAMVQKMCKILLQDFVSRNRLKQIEQTRMWWSTTKFDSYPSQSFLDVFFTYLPSRMQDTYFINPYDSSLTRQGTAKTCPLKL